MKAVASVLLIDLIAAGNNIIVAKAGVIIQKVIFVFSYCNWYCYGNLQNQKPISCLMPLFRILLLN